MAQVITEQSSSHSTIRAEMVRTVEEFDRLRGEWMTLYARAHNASFSLHHDWLSGWLGIAGARYLDGDAALRVICCRRDRELVGVLPLYIRRPQRMADGGRHLRFISTGDAIADELCPDYLDLMCLADVKENCAELAWKVIDEELLGSYDRLELSDMADHSSLVHWARSYGTAQDLQLMPRGVCPIADLSGGFEAYLSRLSSNTRQQMRRLLRSAQQAGATMEVATTGEQAEAFYAEMIALHQQRWTSVGEPGCFASEPFTRFHRELIQKWVPAGRARMSRLRVADQTLAVKYGYLNGSRYDFYQSGVRLDDLSPIKSPGIVSFLMLMQDLCDQGVNAFDFLRGSSKYKQRLATDAQPLVQVGRVIWSWRTGVGFVADMGGRCVRKVFQMVRRGPHRRSLSAGRND